MLDAIEAIVPIGSGEWERVEVTHSVDFEEKRRTADSLKRKFRQLYLTKVPTGDPNMPETVRRAKEVNIKIREKALVCIDCDETEEEEEEEGEEKNEDGEGGEEVRDAVVAAGATTLASVPLLSDRRGTEGNAVARTPTAVGLPRRGYRARTVTNPMESAVAYMMQQREESRREERLSREASERRHQEMMAMMMMMINQSNRNFPLTSPSFSSSSRRSEESEEEKRPSI